jgi:hypothetical protein
VPKTLPSPAGFERITETLRRQGRPPAGFDGARVKDYRRVTLRLPPATDARLRAWSAVSGIPVWRLIATVIAATIEALPAADRGDVERLAKRIVERSRMTDTVKARRAAGAFTGGP